MSSDADAARGLLATAVAALSRGDVDGARALCRAVSGALRTTRAPAALAAELARLEARAAFTGGDADAALDALAAALAISDCNGDALGRSQALNSSAIVHLQRGELDEAEALYEAARAAAVRARDRRVVVATTLHLGIISNVRGDLRRARSHYRRALVGARRLGAIPSELHALNNLGMLHADLGQWDEAEEAYAEALAINQRLGDQEALALLHANVAEVWLGRGDLARAGAACDAGVAASARTEHGAHRADLHKMEGVVAREAGLLAKAEAHFTDAEHIARERHDLLLLAEVAREQGDLYRRQGRNRDTLAALNRSHQLFRQLRARRDLADVNRRMGRLEGEFLEVARRWGESIEAKDCYTQGHCQRVADLSCRIAEHAGAAYGFDAQTMFWYRIGALLHDVGKLDVPAEVLNKPGKLSDAEWAMMRGHAEAGVALLGDIEFPWDVRPIVLSHHERWDGKGYPHGLAGETIPLSARVLAVADVYDALTSVRSYKRAMPHEDALRILRQDAGTAFDPQVVAWFEAVAPAWRATLAAAGAGDAAHGADARPAPDVRDQRRIAGLDEVTGLPGRQAFFDECARVLAARADDGRPTTLLLVTLTPPAVGSGDGAGTLSETALAAVAEAISRNTRGGDFVGRYAEREFVVLLPDTNAEEGAATLARLRDVAGTALRRATFDVPPATLELAASVAPEHGTTSGALLATADATRRRGRGGALPPGLRVLQTAA
ncbi:hypothetical protein tb265_09190 [Gemmatimonadetes bacterium T265]|nr:hypothetical protein tb265_09190 [Gemmatimonadetes bacterium T265]